MKMYGIWIPKQGWLKLHDEKLTYDNVLAFDDVEIARFIAGWFNGRVVPVDKSLVELQAKMLLAEGRQKKWQQFKNLFKRKI